VLLVESLGNGAGRARAPIAAATSGERLGPVRLVEPLGEGRWTVELDGEPAGEAPLPPYIREPLDDEGAVSDGVRHRRGSAAAPTAGLPLPAQLVEASIRRG
jgi:S-adenosylmethionine:tRNA ribosyltransferase-isomerase